MLIFENKFKFTVMINDFEGHIFISSHVTVEVYTLINPYISGIRSGFCRYRVCVRELGSIIRFGCGRYRVCV